VFRYVLAWIPMLVIAVANGAIRQLTFAKVMSEPQAHQLSTLIGSVCIGVFIWFVVRAWPPSSSRKALLIGLFWVLLTITFESFMGLVLQHRPLQEILYEYNLFAGRVWVLFLFWLGLAPWAFFRLRRDQRSRNAKWRSDPRPLT
jgi:peptidoglycan biosynthesis protein MviN/MurJ (putative lipid II flippase)